MAGQASLGITTLGPDELVGLVGVLTTLVSENGEARGEEVTAVSIKKHRAVPAVDKLYIQILVSFDQAEPR